MPRVSAAHEQEIRERIVSAAIRVFTERGYGATIQDVVRDSGLSVGAIYTYFKSKEELFLECCEVMTSGSLETLGHMLAGKATTGERLETAMRFYIDSIDRAPEGGPGLVTLVQAWAVAEGEPRIREMLAGDASASWAPARCSCVRASRVASCRPGSTSTRPRVATSRCSTGCSCNASRPASATARPTSSDRRARSSTWFCRSPRTCSRAEHHAGVASPVGYVQTVLGRIDPSELGITLRTSTPRSRCGTSSRAGTTGS